MTKDWPPGCYLLKLVGSGGEEQFVPLTVRDDASTASYVIQNSVTTWQAYNLWGDYSLYYGRTSAGGSDFANRARIVSFDRPYPQTWASGAADFVGNELPLLMHLESLGLDLTYWTDVDLHARPELLMNHKCLFSLGHDEYWSQPMRQGAAQANAAGVNLAFLGANACYRQIRMEPSTNGPNRLQVCYKDAAEDPISARAAGVDHGQLEPGAGRPARVDAHRRHVPVGRGEGLHGGDRRVVVVLRRVQPERRGLVPQRHPRRVRPLRARPCPGRTTSTSWRTRRSRGSPTGPTSPTTPRRATAGACSPAARRASSPCSRRPVVIPSIVIPGPFPGITDVVRRAMENVYGRFGLGPATSYGSSGGNWTEVYTGAAATRGQRRGHHVGLSGTPRADAAGRTTPDLRPRVHDTTFGCDPPTIDPQTWAHPTTLAPARAGRSRGGPWPPPDSPAWC